jgi:hypothetical protein
MLVVESGRIHLQPAHRRQIGFQRFTLAALQRLNQLVQTLYGEHIIDYSSRGCGGMQIPVIDIDGNGDLDVVTAGRQYFGLWGRLGLRFL